MQVCLEKGITVIDKVEPVVCSSRIQCIALQILSIVSGLGLIGCSLANAVYIMGPNGIECHLNAFNSIQLVSGTACACLPFAYHLSKRILC